MATSTAPAAKAKILQLLDARPGLDGVKMTWGEPTKPTDFAPDHIWFVDTEFDQEWGQLGARARRETYTLNTAIQVHRNGDDEQTTETRCWALISELEDALRAHPRLDDLLTVYAEVLTGRVACQPADPQGWLARADVGIRCQARI